MELFLQADTWIAILTLTFLEIILGIDNIIFISITAGKLPKHQIKKATRFSRGLILVANRKLLTKFKRIAIIFTQYTFLLKICKLNNLARRFLL